MSGSPRARTVSTFGCGCFPLLLYEGMCLATMVMCPAAGANVKELITGELCALRQHVTMRAFRVYSHHSKSPKVITSKVRSLDSSCFKCSNHLHSIYSQQEVEQRVEQRQKERERLDLKVGNQMLWLMQNLQLQLRKTNLLHLLLPVLMQLLPLSCSLTSLYLL